MGPLFGTIWDLHLEEWLHGCPHRFPTQLSHGLNSQRVKGVQVGPVFGPILDLHWRRSDCLSVRTDTIPSSPMGWCSWAHYLGLYLEFALEEE